MSLFPALQSGKLEDHLGADLLQVPAALFWHVPLAKHTAFRTLEEAAPARRDAGDRLYRPFLKPVGRGAAEA